MADDVRVPLLPCPFCGGPRVRDYHIRDGRGVGCGDCGASVSAFNPNALSAAAEKWNRRAAAPAEAPVAGEGEDLARARLITSMVDEVIRRDGLLTEAAFRRICALARPDPETRPEGGA